MEDVLKQGICMGEKVERSNTAKGHMRSKHREPKCLGADAPKAMEELESQQQLMAND